MSDSSLALEKIFEEVGWIAKWEARGEARGIAAGEKKGRQEGIYEIARNALVKGLPIDVIHDITGLDIETLEQLAMNDD